MIIYLASYPRSGNTLARNLITHYFGILTSSVYDDQIEYAGLDTYPLQPDEDDRFLIVSRSDAKPYKILKNGLRDYLTDDFRQRLAGADDIYFLKTHELPFDSFYDGEYVITITRHPCAVLYSYYRYLIDIAERAVTQEDVILGRVQFGSWAYFVRRWRQAASSNSTNIFHIKYEDLVDNHTTLIDIIKRITNLKPIAQNQPFPEFESWHELRPDFYRKGDNNQWKNKFTDSLNRLVLRYHGIVMREFKYSIYDAQRDYEISLEEAEHLAHDFTAQASELAAVLRENNRLQNRLATVEENKDKLWERHQANLEERRALHERYMELLRRC